MRNQFKYPYFGNIRRNHNSTMRDFFLTKYQKCPNNWILFSLSWKKYAMRFFAYRKVHYHYYGEKGKHRQKMWEKSIFMDFFLIRDQTLQKISIKSIDSFLHINFAINFFFIYKFCKVYKAKQRLEIVEMSNQI